MSQSRQLERLLQIDELIRSPERHTARSMSALLEVSERTIGGDIAWLRDRYKAPLVYGKHQGWYYTDPDWRLPTIPLTRGELFALTLGARVLEACSGSAYTLDLQSAIARLAERLPEETWVDLQQVADERIVFRPGATINLDPDIWHRLEDACRESKQVWMKYYTASRNTDSERVVNPYLLHIYRGTNPYLIGWCHTRQAMRWFRVDRIRELRRLDTSFERDSSFDAKQQLDEIFQYEVGTGPPVTVRIWFDSQVAPYIRERNWHSTQELQEHPDGAVTLQMRVKGLNDLKRWVLGYGKGAIVREPPELVALVKDEVNGMSQSYYTLKTKGEVHATN